MQQTCLWLFLLDQGELVSTTPDPSFLNKGKRTNLKSTLVIIHHWSDWKKKLLFGSQFRDQSTKHIYYLREGKIHHKIWLTYSRCCKGQTSLWYMLNDGRSTYYLFKAFYSPSPVSQSSSDCQMWFKVNGLDLVFFFFLFLFLLFFFW